MTLSAWFGAHRAGAPPLSVPGTGGCRRRVGPARRRPLHAAHLGQRQAAVRPSRRDARAAALERPPSGRAADGHVRSHRGRWGRGAVREAPRSAISQQELIERLKLQGLMTDRGSFQGAGRARAVVRQAGGRIYRGRDTGQQRRQAGTAERLDLLEVRNRNPVIDPTRPPLGGIMALVAGWGSACWAAHMAAVVCVWVTKGTRSSLRWRTRPASCTAR